ncbi:cadherin-24-like [Anguilla rostrata]|uniref:cadherin-24-like n=1 Tax=Anguilla rostrata TaxID=7938 RepID=UPI0030CBD1BA
MPARALLLLVALCMWEGLWGAKVLRRRGLGDRTQIREDRRRADQWDAGVEDNGVPLVELSELSHSAQEKLLQDGVSAPAFGNKGAPPGSWEPGLKLRGRYSHPAPGRAGPGPGAGGSPKLQEAQDRAAQPPVRCRQDCPHFNQTRFTRTMLKAGLRPDPSVLTLDQTRRPNKPAKLGARLSPGGAEGGARGGARGRAGSAQRGLDPDPQTALSGPGPEKDPDSGRGAPTHRDVSGGPVLGPGGKGGPETAPRSEATARAGHFLKLQPGPNMEPGGPGGGARGRGLVFQEAGEGRGQEGEETRSRSRRSWIWNQFFVIEEYSGPEPVLIGRLHTDMDRGDGRTKYVLRGEGAGSVFVIDEKTGNIHVTKPLDREEKDEYRLIATATDRQTDRALEPSSQFIIRVQDINDNPPLFEDGPYSATVPEMANIGTSIIQVTATDADDPTYGNSARLVYTLVQGQEYFSVDPQTGIVRTAVPDMDRETQDQHLVVLQAKDMGGHLGGLSGTTTVTIRLSDVNDNPPRFTQSAWSFSLSELAVPGAEVGRLSATDADLGDNAKLEYTILEGDVGDTFNITGLNQEAIITLNKAVDYEARGAYAFAVEVLNPAVDPRFLRRGPFKDRASVRVTVLDADEPPRFSRQRYLLDVRENCAPACAVGRVGAVDPDTGQNSNIRYSIDPQSDPEALFRIAPDNGLITTAVELDREHEQWHNITVIATQRDSPGQVSRVAVAIETLDVNDNAPELERQYTTALCDSAAAGQVVLALRAVDKDKGGNESLVHFSIPLESSAAHNFTVRGTGGPTASLVLLSSLSSLPRSPSSSLTLQVPLVLKDSLSGLSSTGTVTVSVCPCLQGGARAGPGDGDGLAETVCLPLSSSSPSPGLSTAALLAILACIITLLAVSALSLSLRRQKRDSLSPLEEDDVRENIITYDDEGGGEADTAAFDMAALQSAPHSTRRGYRTLDSRNIRYSGRSQERGRTYSWSQNPGLGFPNTAAAPLYGRLCYSSHTLPVLRHAHGHAHGHAPFEPGLADPGDPRRETEPAGAAGGSDSGAPPTPDSKDSSEPGYHTHSLDWADSLVLTRCGPAAVRSSSGSSWACESAGRQGVRAGPSPTRISTGASAPSLPGSLAAMPLPHGSHGSGGESQAAAGFCRSNSAGQQGALQEGTLGRHRLAQGGGISLAGTTCSVYPEGTGLIPDWGDRVGVRGYGLGRRDMLPHLLPFPGQNRGVLGQLGYGGGRGQGGGNSLAVRVGEFLRLRLAQVTFDPSLPPYDSVQIYGFEGEGSRAGSLSSLESEGEKEGEKEGVEDWGPRFHRLAELFQEREREREEERERERETEIEADRGEKEEGEGKGRSRDEGKQE